LTLNDDKFKSLLDKLDDQTIVYAFYNAKDALLKKLKKQVSKELFTKIKTYKPKKNVKTTKEIDNAKNRLRYHFRKI